MKILHITPSSDGYEVVELLANRYSKDNHLSVIKQENGEIHITGGFLINDTPKIRKILDTIPKSEQYSFISDFKKDPFIKFYFTE